LGIARYGHVELLSGGVELDSKKGGNVSGNYAGKNGDQKEVSAVSAPMVIILMVAMMLIVNFS
jgi:hypothetical protein